MSLHETLASAELNDPDMPVAKAPEKPKPAPPAAAPRRPSLVLPSADIVDELNRQSRKSKEQEATAKPEVQQWGGLSTMFSDEHDNASPTAARSEAPQAASRGRSASGPAVSAPAPRAEQRRPSLVLPSADLIAELKTTGSGKEEKPGAQPQQWSGLSSMFQDEHQQEMMPSPESRAPTSHTSSTVIKVASDAPAAPAVLPAHDAVKANKKGEADGERPRAMSDQHAWTGLTNTAGLLGAMDDYNTPPSPKQAEAEAAAATLREREAQEAQAKDQPPARNEPHTGTYVGYTISDVSPLGLITG